MFINNQFIALSNAVTRKHFYQSLTARQRAAVSALVDIELSAGKSLAQVERAAALAAAKLSK